MRRACAGAGILTAVLMAAAAPAGVEVGLEQPAIPAAPEVAARAALLRLGHAEVLRFSQSVGTIVVGDSGVLSATAVNDSTVVLTALATGRTNVVVLGQEGQVLSRLNVRVAVPQVPKTTVYRGAARSVLVCDPDCAPPGEAAGGPAPPPEVSGEARVAVPPPAAPEVDEEEVPPEQADAAAE